MCVLCLCAALKENNSKVRRKEFRDQGDFLSFFQESKKKKKCRGIKGKQSKRGSKIKEDQEAMLDQIKEKRP